jgi:hypothetical protein
VTPSAACGPAAAASRPGACRCVSLALAAAAAAAAAAVAPGRTRRRIPLERQRRRRLALAAAGRSHAQGPASQWSAPASQDRADPHPAGSAPACKFLEACRGTPNCMWKHALTEEMMAMQAPRTVSFHVAHRPCSMVCIHMTRLCNHLTSRMYTKSSILMSVLSHLAGGGHDITKPLGNRPVVVPHSSPAVHTHSQQCMCAHLQRHVGRREPSSYPTGLGGMFT